MPICSRLTGLLALALLLLPAARAQFTVQSTVTPGAGTFHYDYTISNQTATDVSSVTLEGLPLGASTVLNLTAPATFVAFFDTGLGLLTFQEGSASFTAGSTVSGFGFDSSFGPGTSAFSAVDINGGSLSGSTLSAVPEPATNALIGAVLALGFVLWRKHCSASSPSLATITS
ncbi:MAG: PEP-CTERM sorting domain-containing protein [Opitutae bacterium]|nr:PEP-CTERM sorting domain-containing protein [Opitutae bacterium]